MNVVDLPPRYQIRAKFSIEAQKRFMETERTDWYSDFNPPNIQKMNISSGAEIVDLFLWTETLEGNDFWRVVSNYNPGDNSSNYSLPALRPCGLESFLKLLFRIQ